MTGGQDGAPSGLAALRGASPADAARLVWRKAVHRRVEMGRYEVRAGKSVPPATGCDLRLEVWGPDRFDELRGTSPHLSGSDVDLFGSRRSAVVVALDGDRVAASSWMTGGQVFVSELQRFVEVPEGEHYSCRSFVHPDYRGRSLGSHMLHHFSVQQPPGDLVWGLIYDWNTASLRLVEQVGWRRTGDYWATWWFGRQGGGERRYPPRARGLA